MMRIDYSEEYCNDHDDDDYDDDDDDEDADLPPQERLLDRSLPVPRGTMAVGGFPDNHHTFNHDNDHEHDHD